MPFLSYPILLLFLYKCVINSMDSVIILYVYWEPKINIIDKEL